MIVDRMAQLLLVDIETVVSEAVASAEQRPINAACFEHGIVEADFPGPSLDVYDVATPQGLRGSEAPIPAKTRVPAECRLPRTWVPGVMRAAGLHEPFSHGTQR